MKLLVITREFPPHVLGGTSYHLAHLYSEIAARGHDVTVLAGACAQSTSEATALVADDIDVRTIQFGSIRGHHLRYPARLRAFLRGFDTDAYDLAMVHTQVPFDVGLPTITKYHDCPRVGRRYLRREMSRPLRVVDALIDPSRRWVERRSLQEADHAIFNSRLCLEAWRDHYEIPRDNTVVYNGVDREVFRQRSTDSGDNPYVLFVGASERKGLSRVLDYARTADYRVLLIGDPDVETPNVDVLGRVTPDRLAELYSGAVATIHPARFEAFGNVILESLSCQTPVVATDQCGASELLTADAGVVTGDIAQGVEESERLDGADCRAIATEHTWDAVAAETIAIAEQYG